MPDALLMGEADGLPIPGFDLSNSPAELVDKPLEGRHLIQRTTSGTQGVVRSIQAEPLLASSLVCAGATANFIQKLSPDSLTFVITGRRPGGWGDEDAACADYIEALLAGQKSDQEPILERVRQSPPGKLFSDPTQIEFNPADLEYCLQINRFDFIMRVKQEDGLFIMKAMG